jgi:hypothetical protein
MTDLVSTLERIPAVAADYGLPTAEMKTCITAILSGAAGVAERHQAAFTLAAEFRRMGLDQRQAERALAQWARTIGYGVRAAQRQARFAYRKNPGGDWRYPPPGLKNRPGGTYDRVISPLCREFGCPANCPAFSSRRRSGKLGEGYERFVQLGWPAALGRRRGVGDTYRAICRREEEIEWTPGDAFHVAHDQLVARTDHRSRTTVRRHLIWLAETGLITYIEGSGRKGERRASQIARVVPLPAPSVPALRTGVVTAASTRIVTAANTETTPGESEEQVLREIDELLLDGTLMEIDP